MKGSSASRGRAVPGGLSGPGAGAGRGSMRCELPPDTALLHQIESFYRRILDLETRVWKRTSELRRSHRALQESEQKYRRVFSTIADGAFVFDAHTRRIVEVNEAALRLYGYSRKEFLRLNHRSITAEPEDSDATIRLAMTGVPVRIPLRYHRRKDRSVFPVEISASAFRFRGRMLVCGIIKDITHNVELEREILAAGEQEQQRLGRDLHDDLCQQLAGIQFLCQTLVGELAERKAGEARQAREIADMVQSAMSQTRDLARGLSPVRFETDGLAHALRELALRTGKVFRIKCRFRRNAAVPVPQLDTATHLYRIAQEAVGNAVKHSKAKHIEICLARRGRDLVLRVSDDGIGFPRESANHEGMGMRIMRYRAKSVGGSLKVQSRMRQGTAVVCVIAEGLPPPRGGNGK